MNIHDFSTEELRRLISERWGHSVASPADCELLSTEILHATKEYVSVNTLKRLLGFIAYGNTHRLSTLNIIAQYLGYEKWNDLVASMCNNSDFGKSLSAVSAIDIPEGGEVEITYAPDRQIILCHQQGNLFEVKNSGKGKLQVGDRIEVSQFVLGYPPLRGQCSAW